MFASATRFICRVPLRSFPSRGTGSAPKTRRPLLMTGLLKRRAFGLPRRQASFPSALGNDLVPPRHMKSVPEADISERFLLTPFEFWIRKMPCFGRHALNKRWFHLIICEWSRGTKPVSKRAESPAMSEQPGHRSGLRVPDGAPCGMRKGS